jgi:hypothetical protein
MCTSQVQQRGGAEEIGTLKIWVVGEGGWERLGAAQSNSAART